MAEVLAVLIVGLGTYFSRAVFIIALANREIPPTIVRSLQYVAPAVLSALVVALLIDSDGNVALGGAEMAGLVAGGAIAFKTRNHILTLVGGMTVFWIVGALS